mmetsp:Transcript_8350/g.23029  ORF Transcript_8350/g.23029 Transcript_8350/m.23029 type:complete len:219 (-) Transcript_8350:17-673(-)
MEMASRGSRGGAGGFGVRDCTTDSKEASSCLSISGSLRETPLMSDTLMRLRPTPGTSSCTASHVCSVSGFCSLPGTTRLPSSTMARRPLTSASVPATVMHTSRPLQDSKKFPRLSWLKGNGFGAAASCGSPLPLFLAAPPNRMDAPPGAMAASVLTTSFLRASGTLSSKSVKLESTSNLPVRSAKAKLFLYSVTRASCRSAVAMAAGWRGTVRIELTP